MFFRRFFVLVCLAVFTLLLSLRFDQTLKCSYWLIFMPLWFWKFTATIGFLVGTIFWCRLTQKFVVFQFNPDQLCSTRGFFFICFLRYERETFTQFKAMTMSFIANTILFIFELLICQNLEEFNILWMLCFVPLLVLAIISLPVCIWSIRHDRSYEMELLCSFNLLQFIFIGLRLDAFINWSWAVSFNVQTGDCL